MKRIIIILLGLFSLAYGQFSPSGSKIRYVNGTSLGTKLDAYFNSADSNAIYWRADSVLRAKYRGMARTLAFIDNLSDSIIWGNISGSLNNQTDLRDTLAGKVRLQTGNLFRQDGKMWISGTIRTSGVLRADEGYFDNFLSAVGGNFFAYGDGINVGTNSAGAASVNFKQGTTAGLAGAGFSSLYFTNRDTLSIASNRGGVSYATANISLDNIPNSTVRTYALPNASGTIALTSNVTDSSAALRASINTKLNISDTAAMLANYPLINGTRATGTWNISITGNAQSATQLNVNSFSSGSGAIAVASALAPGVQNIVYNGSLTYNATAATLFTPNAILSGSVEAGSFIKTGGTSSQFLKADGSVDGNTYATTSSLSGYVPYTGATTNVNLGSNTITAGGATLTGALSGTSASFGNGSNNTNEIQINDALNRNAHIGTGFGATFLQWNNYFNGASYVFDDNTQPSTALTMSSSGFAFQTGAANVNPSTKVIFDINGNVGIGTTIVENKLIVENAAAGGAAWTNNAISVVRDFGSITRAQNGDLIGKITIEGRWAGGITDAGAQIRAFAVSSGNNYPATDMAFFTSAANAVATEKMRITSAGRLLVNTTTDDGSSIGQFNGNVLVSSSGTTSIRLKGSSVTGFDLQNDVAGAYLWNRDATDMYFGTNNTLRLSINGSTGAATFSSSVTATGFIVSSDYRYKDIISQDGDLYTYTLKNDESKRVHYGYVAQDVEKWMPHAVSTNEQGYKAVNYIEVLAFKVRELEKQIEQLKNDKK